MHSIKAYFAESVIKELIEKIAKEKQVSNNFYGNQYPNEVIVLQQKMASSKNSEWGKYLQEAKIILESYI